MSIGHRATGAFHSALLYAAGASFAYASLSDSTSVAQLYTSLVDLASTAPLPLEAGVKAGLALPFVYHCLNGVRHLGWDMGVGLSLRGVYASGWAVNAGAVIGGALLTLM
jgi:succinate dehydrogenase (ubiquinone) cytochrome b560 subunit